MDINLHGHSGCNVKIINVHNCPVVRKISSSEEYNARLEQQYKKQKQMSLGDVQVTPVQGCGYINGLFYFDMDYVNGTTLSEYLKSISLSEISTLVDHVMSHIYVADYDLDAKPIFLKKIQSVLDNIRSMPEYLEYSNMAPIIKKTEKILKKQPWNSIIRTPCHGDYTLENLLITKKNQIFAIDFLDSFYDSWQVDVAKLLQDVELGWSYRFSIIDVNLRMRLIVMRTCITSKIYSLHDGENIMNAIYGILLLNTLRIIPYTHDSVTIEHLLNNLQYLCQKLCKRE